jgi:hypothetical protein
MNMNWIPTCDIKQPTKNVDIFIEVCDLIYEVRKTKLTREWRGSLIEPQPNSYVKVSHGEQYFCHWSIELLALTFLNCIHDIHIHDYEDR